jgi:aldehyde dehydrogenase (NAD+)
MQTITKHYIDGAFVDSHGREVMDIIKPTNGKVVARATIGDEEDTRRAIAAAKRAFVTFGRTTKEGRASYLRLLHAAVLARIDDLTAAMVEEYGGVVQFARPISAAEAADRFAIRELVEAYAHCADRRNAKGQMALFTQTPTSWCI